MNDWTTSWPKTFKDDIWKALMDYQSVNAKKPVVQDPLEAFNDSQLIMEMLRRGYAVAQMPAEELAEELGKNDG